ncbi:TPA: hypothetical protein ACLEZY_004993 [Pseudomonas aeruginosa]
MSTPQPFGWVVNCPKEMEPVEAFTRDKASAEKYRAAGWTVIEVFTEALRTQLSEANQAYYRLIEHANETEQYLDEAAEVLADIAKSDQAYRECTDKSSPTGQRIAAVLSYVAQFQPEPHPEDEGEPTEWSMNPCKQGHRDVGAAGGVAHCCQCGEKIEAATTQAAFEQWNATHPAVPN